MPFISLCYDLHKGTAAIFALSESNLHLIRVFNDDFGTKGSLTNYIEVSFDGNFLAVGWKSKCLHILENFGDTFSY